MLYIREIEIENLFGTAHARFVPGILTIVAGENGAGKSSILRAVLLPFEGGHDARWLRGYPENPAKSGHVKLTLTNGVTIKKTVTPKGSRLDILSAEGLEIKSPVAYLKELGDAWAISPGKLLALDTRKAADRQELVETLLKLVPMEFRIEDVKLQFPEDLAAIPWTSDCDLEGFDRLIASIAEKRRAIGHARAEAEKTVQTLRKTIPPAAEDKDWNAEVIRLQEERHALDKDTRSAERTIEKWAYDETQRIEREKQERLKAVASRLAPKASAIASALVIANERASQAAGVTAQRELLGNQENQLKANAALYDQQSRILEAMAAARKAKIKDLPVSGLDFDQEHGALLDGVPWAVANTGGKLMAILQMMAPRAGKLPFILVDEESLLDTGNRQEVEEAFTAAGYQVFVARVQDGPLTITPVYSVGQQPDGTLIAER